MLVLLAASVALQLARERSHRRIEPFGQEPARAKVEPDLEAIEGQCVLVLDGETASRQALGEMLGTLGTRPTLTNDPAAARDALAQAAGQGEPFALMIVDPCVRGSVTFRAQRAEDDPLVAATPRVFLESPGDQGGGGPSGFPRLERPVTRTALIGALRRALAEPPPPAAPAARDERSDPLRVLVAEDNRVNAFMAARMLERLGHRVEVVADGAQAVAAFERGDFQVVLMDLQMPGMDGFEAIRRIRAVEGSGRRTRVIAVSAFDAEDERERSRSAGMDGVLAKPFTLEVLADALTRGSPRGFDDGGDRGEVPSPPGNRFFDLERLTTQLGGDHEAVAEVLDGFARDAPAILLELREAVAGGDLERVKQAAHRLKGSLLWITAETAATRAATLESRAREGDTAALRQALDALDQEVGRVLEDAARRPRELPS
jgi:CheY-like chemotaxis protein